MTTTENIRRIASLPIKGITSGEKAIMQRRVARDHRKLLDILSSEDPPFIYGVNSLVGHLDERHLPDSLLKELQQKLIDNHTLDLGGDPYSRWQVQCMFYAKLRAVQAGGTGMSPELVDELIRLYDQGMFDLRIPSGASYSCGDVNPGTRFLVEISRHFEGCVSLGPKDAISMMNGAFVSAGLALALLPRLMRTLDDICVTMVSAFHAFGISRDILVMDRELSQLTMRVYDAVAGDVSTGHPITTQPSISMRCTLRSIHMLETAVYDLACCVEDMLNDHSDNPVITGGGIYSNSSYMSPLLGMRLSGVIDALMFNAWAVERSMHFLAGGRTGDPVSLTTDEWPLGIVQIPKLATNLLQNMRLECGVRPYAVGLSTYHDIEDLWVTSERQSHQIASLTDGMQGLTLIHRLISGFRADGDYRKVQEGITHASDKHEVCHEDDFMFLGA